MTTFPDYDGGSRGVDDRTSPAIKAPPPVLSMRAPRPPATRLRKSVVQAIIIGGVVLVSGSLAWAFIIQPELRDSALAKAAESREEQARGVVRPAEAVTDQPATYDRLPAPREAAEENTVDPAVTAPGVPPVGARDPYTPQHAPRLHQPNPQDLAARSGLFFEATRVPNAQPTSGSSSSQLSPSADLRNTYNSNVLTSPLSPYELKAGAIIPAVLLTGIDTSRAGPVVATVSQNVYDSISGRHLVLPQGTRLIGRHEGESAYGDRRAFLVWDRLILPNGKSLLLSEEPGVDAQGAVGIRGQVDRRLMPLLTGALFAGAITTLGQIARDDDRSSRSILGDAGDAAAIEASQVGGRLVDRELQVRPSIRLRPGAPVRVMITRDLVLEPFQS